MWWIIGFVMRLERVTDTSGRETINKYIWRAGDNLGWWEPIMVSSNIANLCCITHSKFPFCDSRTEHCKESLETWSKF